jgi:hypothetical protein
MASNDVTPGSWVLVLVATMGGKKDVGWGLRGYAYGTAGERNEMK